MERARRRLRFIQREIQRTSGPRISIDRESIPNAGPAFIASLSDEDDFKIIRKAFGNRELLRVQLLFAISHNYIHGEFMPAQSLSGKIRRNSQMAMRLLSLLTNAHGRSRKKYFLGALAIMHNEGHIIREWIETHLREGIEHFFLIDHRSTDDWRNRIADHMDRGCITVAGATLPNVDDARIEGSTSALDECEWLLILDLDEFTYSRTEGTISEHLCGLPETVAQVKIPWLLFGTGGNVYQASSVVRQCRLRENISLQEGRRWHCKSIIRTQRLLKLRIHGHVVYGTSVASFKAFPVVDNGPYLSDDLRIRESELLIVQNHYALQSREHFEQKAKRQGYGKGARYTEANFKKTESFTNLVEDSCLYNKYRTYYDGIV